MMNGNYIFSIITGILVGIPVGFIIYSAGFKLLEGKNKKLKITLYGKMDIIGAVFFYLAQAMFCYKLFPMIDPYFDLYGLLLMLVFVMVGNVFSSFLKTKISYIKYTFRAILGLSLVVFFISSFIGFILYLESWNDTINYVKEAGISMSVSGVSLTFLIAVLQFKDGESDNAIQ
ncbi:MAG: hypothetical protein M3043_07650 [Lysinibacillus fusiformis]|uniref:hypothetical protein n=1 Tax=Lysinibacillus fusiformis TaxID=28031 RepID=UPI001ABF6DDD|nr:hypothetical protein [Lysinibacillus fusiformis]MCT6816264.1 hypothetical protein [Lysinibacillus fusiformis]MCT6927446.1 hypothetical protein [Lysinibacillus fusiformis]MCT6931782.1 hypothetical protein [Lysinibacillus fusiformis]